MSFYVPKQYSKLEKSCLSMLGRDFSFLSKEKTRDIITNKGLQTRINVLPHLILFCRVTCGKMLQVHNINVSM